MKQVKHYNVLIHNTCCGTCIYGYIDPASRCFIYVCCLTEDWTKDRGKWISLNSDFNEQILDKKYIGVENVVVVSHWCSLCWMSKVYLAASLRLRDLLIHVDSASRR